MDKLVVLYICIDSTLGGSTASLLNLIDSVKDEVYPIVLFPEEGVGQAYFAENDIECYVYPFIKLYKFKKNRLIDVWQYPWRWHYIKKWRNEKGCIRFVKDVLKGRHVDIVHSNTSPNDIGVSLAKALRAKHVWHVREFVDTHFHFDIYRGIPRLRKLINQADARIAISSAVKNHWEMLEENTWVINDAVRCMMDTCYYPAKEPYVLFSSYNLTEEKGSRLAIEAFAKSGIAEKGFRLMLMGNCKDEYKSSLLNTICGFGVEDSVEFVPCQTDVKPWFAKATAYIMASECEGLGRVTAEAMFFGCPVIARATGGTLDLVKDGETGCLFDTVDECAALLRELCVRDNKAMILRAQEFVEHNLSQEVYGPKVMEVYKNVLI
jgi:glycosyltransferase involved in cell wall biosynthesis